MQKFYESRGIDDDPIINQALALASQGIRSGHISDAGVIGAIQEYSGRYAEAFENTSANDIVKYSDYKLPDEAKDAFSEYGDKNLVELDKMIKDDKDAQRVAATIQILRDYKLDVSLTPKLLKDNVNAQLKNLYRKEEKKQ